MNNFWNSFLAGLRGIRKAYVISVMVVLVLVLSLVLYANGTIDRVSAALRGETPVAAVNTQVEATATIPPLAGMETPTSMPAMAGMGTTDPTMPDMVMPTSVPVNGQPTNPNDLNALTTQMQDMMNSLQGMMVQLDQKGTGAYLPPTATPVAVDMQAIMAELQSINRDMAPLMVRIQADLQGNPSPEELASVRSQVEQISFRVGNLLMQLQMARGVTEPGMANMPGMNNTPSMTGMQGMMQPTQPASGYQQDPAQVARMAQLDQMMQQMQVMLQQMQMGGTSGQQGMGAMPGMNITSPTPMPGMAGMTGSTPSMDDMMMMDNMMAMMDNMMGMGGSSMAAPTADPAMSGMMMMMDNMMLMMDQMMDMDMMGMPDM